MRDKKFMERLIERADKAGCSALVLTLDLQILGQRHKDIRNGLSTPLNLLQSIFIKWSLDQNGVLKCANKK